MGIKRATKSDLTINSKAWGIVYRLVVLLLIFCVMGRQKCVKEPVPGDTLKCVKEPVPADTFFHKNEIFVRIYVEKKDSND